MEKTILIAGKEFPDGKEFAESMLMANRNVVITSKTETKEILDGEVIPFFWNKVSPVSSRAAILFSESVHKNIDEVILYFDESYFASLFTGFAIEDFAKSADEMILSFEYMVYEVLSRFEKRYLLDSTPEQMANPAKLVFAIKKNPSELDVLKNPPIRTEVTSISNALTSSAAAAFAAFAETIAAQYGNREFVSVLLVKTESTSELYKKDSSFASWLAQYLDELDKQKNKLTAKQSVSWIKAGSKAAGLFSFLKK